MLFLKDVWSMSLCTLMNQLSLFRHRNLMIAFELSIFDDINSESGLTYGSTKIFLSLLELVSVESVTFFVLCTNSFFNLEFILSKIRSRG